MTYSPRFGVFLLLFVFTFSSLTMAQEFATPGLSGATNKINLSYTPQYFLNGINIDHDGISPDVLSTKNTGGYTLSLEYQRTTRYHMIYGGGFLYSRQEHDVSVTYTTLDFFTSPGQPKLGYFYYGKHYKGVSANTGFRLFTGYRWENPLKGSTGWDIDGGIGLMLRLHLKGYEEQDASSLSYFREDPPTIFNRTLSVQSVQFGHDLDNSWSWDENLEVYIGFSKNMSWYFIQDFNIGIVATHGLSKYGNGSVSVDTYQQELPQVRSTDQYNSRDLSLGLRLGIGLWP